MDIVNLVYDINFKVAYITEFIVAILLLNERRKRRDETSISKTVRNPRNTCEPVFTKLLLYYKHRLLIYSVRLLNPCMTLNFSDK